METVIGNVLGLIPQSIEVSNLIVGDLPFDHYGDFYLVMETASAPRQCSAVVRDGLAKVTHFADKMILSIRDNCLEGRVVFAVWELNVAGSEKLCEISLSATDIVDWSRPCSKNEPPKRFLMSVMNSSPERVTTPWIVMKFQDVSSRLHNIEKEQSAYFDEDAKVRLKGKLYPQDVQATRSHDSLSCMSCYSSVPRQDTLMQTWSEEGLDGEVTHYKIDKFKQEFSPLDQHGHLVGEPEEEDLRELRGRERCCHKLYQIITFFEVSVVVVWFTFRSYIFSCYRQYRWMTVAEQQDPNIQNELVSLTTGQLHAKYLNCQPSVPLPNRTDTTWGCDPPDTVVQARCEKPVKEEMRPRAFSDFADFFDPLLDKGFTLPVVGNFSIRRGVSCRPEFCKMRNEWIMDVDANTVGILLALVLLNCLVRCVVSCKVRRDKRKTMQNRRDEKRKKERGRGSKAWWTLIEKSTRNEWDNLQPSCRPNNGDNDVVRWISSWKAAPFVSACCLSLLWAF